MCGDPAAGRSTLRCDTGPRRSDAERAVRVTRRRAIRYIMLTEYTDVYGNEGVENEKRKPSEQSTCMGLHLSFSHFQNSMPQ